MVVGKRFTTMINSGNGTLQQTRDPKSKREIKNICYKEFEIKYLNQIEILFITWCTSLLFLLKYFLYLSLHIISPPGQMLSPLFRLIPLSSLNQGMNNTSDYFGSTQDCLFSRLQNLWNLENNKTVLRDG